jgi:hypothetical protein
MMKKVKILTTISQYNEKHLSNHSELLPVV